MKKKNNEFWIMCLCALLFLNFIYMFTMFELINEPIREICQGFYSNVTMTP